MIKDLAIAFARDGWSVSILACKSKDTAPVYPKKLAQRISFHSAGTLPSKSILGYIRVYLFLFFKLVSLKKPDIIVTLTDPPMLITAGRFAAFLKGSKHIHWCHDLYPDLFPFLGVKLPKPLQSFLKKLSRRAMKRTDKVIVPGRCMARKLTHTGVEPSRITVIPNWFNPVLDKSAIKTGGIESKAKKGQKQPLFVDDAPRFRVLYAGTAGKLHPMDTVFEAAVQLEQTHPDIEFVFVGQGKGHEVLSKLRARYALDNIRFLPYQPEHKLRELMESGDVHLAVLEKEAAGLCVPSKFYSALGAGRPAVFIGSNESEIAKVIEDFNCGDVVAPDDVSALVHVLTRYRDSEKNWFEKQSGALKASKQMTPEQSWMAWLKRANDVLKQPE